MNLSDFELEQQGGDFVSNYSKFHTFLDYAVFLVLFLLVFVVFVVLKMSF